MTLCSCPTLHILCINYLPLSLTTLSDYHNCNHRERVDCLVHVTHSQGPALPDPVGPLVAVSHTPRGV